jgi:hypothetical protein
MTTAAGRLRAPAGQQGSGNQARRPLRRGTLSGTAQRASPGWPFRSARLHDHITPLACEIQHRHHHGALGMKTAPRACLAF